jgi:1,4-dihydroxy-2-naphthoate octaprenyltransferase
MVDKWIAWVRVIRIKFFVAGIPSVILGAAISWYLAQKFDLHIFLLTLIGVMLAMAGCYLFNEYFDFKSGVDVIVKKEDITPYSAGSRMLPEGYVSPSSVLMAGIIFWFLACVVGVYLTMTRGLLTIILALLGFFAGALYALPPFKWAYRGIGEFLIGLAYGPLITLGSCYVQLMTLRLESAIAPSLVPGLLITAVILINEFPDFHADKKAEKKNLVVRIGRKSAVKLYIFLVTSPYLIIISNILLKLFPLTTSIAISTLPIALRNALAIKRRYNKKARDIVPIMTETILLFVSTTLLLSAGYILALSFSSALLNLVS